jgi:hypothetical protein
MRISVKKAVSSEKNMDETKLAEGEVFSAKEVKSRGNVLGTFPSYVANGVEQPCTGKNPAAFHHRNGKAQGLGNFLVGHPTKIPKFHNLSVNWILLGKLLNRVVHSQQLIIPGRGRQIGILQFDALKLTAVALGLTPTRAIDEYSAHGLRGHSEEVCTVFILSLTSANQFQPRFMYQCSGLERLTRGFVGHLVASQSPQFVVYKR